MKSTTQTTATSTIPILMYHRIGPRASNSIVRDQYVSERLFESHLNCLKSKGYRTVTLGTAIRYLDLCDAYPNSKEPTTPAEQPLVAITFDDGYQSFYTAALPILERHGMNATVFLVANCVGFTNRWDEAKGDRREELMTVDQIQAAHAKGMEFGAHTLTHPDLRFCDDHLASREIAGSKEVLEAKLGFKVEFFSYPYGKNGQRERALVKEAGYLAACGTSKKANDFSVDPFDLGRINVRATTGPLYLLRKMNKVSKKHA